MPRNYNPRELVVVEIKPSGVTLQYGFKSGLKAETDKTALGQFSIGDITSNVGLIIGCNNPKPAKARKKNQTSSTSGTVTTTTFTGGSISSFVAHDAYVSAKAAQWIISAPPDLRNAQGAKYVTVNGVKYGWRSPSLPSGVTAPTEDTGVATGDGNDVLCFGCSFPKPPRMKKQLAGGNTYSSFVAPAKVDDLKTAGWESAGKALLNSAFIGSEATPTPTPTPTPDTPD